MLLKTASFPVPPLFDLIQKSSSTPWVEMYRVFNMGHRMELYVSPGDAQAIIDIAAAFSLEARVVGHCEACAVQKAYYKE